MIQYADVVVLVRPLTSLNHSTHTPSGRTAIRGLKQPCPSVSAHSLAKVACVNGSGSLGGISSGGVLHGPVKLVAVLTPNPHRGLGTYHWYAQRCSVRVR